MSRTGLVLIAFVLGVCLSGCNTTDALTPQVDVGGGLHPSPNRSSPVSQDEANRLAARADPPAVNRGFPQAPQPHPQNTMQAQARALDADEPVTSAPLAPPPAEPPPSAPPATQPPANAPEPALTANAGDPSQAASSGGTIRFLPIIGAPLQAVTPLSRQLGTTARESGLTIKSSGDATSEHILKGYLSAFDNEGKVTVVYVWDVLDAAGARLHRIQGQETVPASAADPWAAVPAATMQAIGQKTITDYVAWRQARPG